ncbi:MAG: N-acetylmuramoyl-L-alanine amidase, partial [Kiritimatiellae bacterium]|nr:N-acetylmuramoyl-L-alanine amidase [Kiritimatiellia bacterium]
MRYLSILVLIGIAGLSLRAQPPKGGWAPFKKVGERLGVTNVVWDGSSLAFSNATRCVRFHSGQKRAEVNGVTVWMNQPPEGSPADGSWKMAALDLDFLTLAILPEKEAAKPKPLHILLDPGHGGVDDGAVNGEVALSEKAFSLAIANRLGPLLEKAGFTVSYTRTNDVALTLGQRTRMVTPLKADLFISLHANHAANREAIGFETYVIPPSGFTGTSVGSRLCTWQPGNKNEFQSTSLGFAIQRRFSLSQTNRVDRGLKRQSYYVLRESPCPAVLIEFGFISN